ncbi:MAG: hypothetical protein IJK51_07160 [Bacteroidaceae bacterium]|nr:hypothetical protein [Bacteroidaceae bacterium]
MKKYYLILVLLFMAGFAWAADDNLYCCGQKQTSLYNWKYTPTNNINGAIQMGSISYDAASKTVTFDGAYATVTGDNRIFYNKNVPGLKIVFKGYCRLRSDKCVFRLDKDTEMKGSTDRVEFMALGDNAECIYCPNETSLTISDFAKLRMTSKYWRAINTNGTEVTIKNSRVSAEGADCAIQNNKGNDEKGDLYLDGCFIRDTWTESNGSVGGDPYLFSGSISTFVEVWNQVRVHTSMAKSVMIILAEDYIGVKLKGIALTKGWCECTDPTNPAYDIEDYYIYDESTNTLTLKKDYRAMTEEQDYSTDERNGIKVSKPITIDGGGHFVYGRLGMLCRSDVTLRNIIIGGNEDYGIEIYVGDAANNVTLTLKDNVIIGGVENAIYARHGHGDVVFNPSLGTTVQLFPCDKNFKVKSTFDDKPIRVNSTTLQDCYVSEPAGGGVGTSGIEVDGNTVFSKVVVTGYEPYDLWVGETQVTSLNASDILGDGGHFKYNASTKTLTVSNATFENQSTDDNYGGIYNYGIDGLTVKFYGKSTFDTFRNSIFSKKDITLAGNGSLTATVGSSTNGGIFLYKCTCTINGPQLDFTAPEEPIYSATNSTLNVMGSTTRLALHPGVGYHALRMSELNIGEGLYITEPLGGYFDSDLHSITVDGTNPYKGDVLISSTRSEAYDLWVGETQVTTFNASDILNDGGHFSYDASTKTLTVNNATFENQSTDQRYGGIYNYGIDGLTVNFVGESTFNTYANSIYSEEDITLAGNGSLTATVGPDIWCCILLYDCTCTINGPQFDFTSAEEAIYDNSNNSTLNVMGSTTRLALHPGEGYSALHMSALNLGEGIFISEPLGGYFSPDLLSITVDGTNAYKSDVIIEKEQLLGFSINGQKMGMHNMNNVPGVKSGLAHVEVSEPDAPTLVLDNATLDWNDADEALSLNLSRNLTIKVVGNCTINAKDHTGLSLSGRATIEGGGTLRINAKQSAIETFDYARFTIRTGTSVIAHSSDSYGYNDRGMEDGAYCTIESGALLAAFGAEPYPTFRLGYGLVRLGEGIDVRYPIGARFSNRHIYNADGTEVTNDWVVIGPNIEPIQDLVDGVDEIANGRQTTDNGFIYNIAGQQMSNSKLPRGIFIKDGKKVMVK